MLFLPLRLLVRVVRLRVGMRRRERQTNSKVVEGNHGPIEEVETKMLISLLVQSQRMATTTTTI